MALFDNLFGKKREPKEELAPQAGPGAPVGFFPEGVDMSDWDQVFSACLGKMYTVQNRLGMAASLMCPTPGCGAGRM